MDSLCSGKSSASHLCVSPQASILPAAILDEGSITGSMQSTLHNFDSVPNIFSQLNEFVKLDQQDRVVQNKEPVPLSVQKYTDGNVLCTSSVISSLQNVLNLSNVNTSSLGNDKPDKLKLITPETNNLLKFLEENTKKSDTDDENNEIIFECSASQSDNNYVIPSKKLKLSLNMSSEERLLFDNYQKLYQADRIEDMKVVNESYRENLTELFFLQNGGNLMDYYAWKKRPNTLLACYLLSEKLESDEFDGVDELSQNKDSILSALSSVSVLPNISTAQPIAEIDDSAIICSSLPGFTSINSTLTTDDVEMNAALLNLTPLMINKSTTERILSPSVLNIGILKSSLVDNAGCYSKSGNVDGILKSPASISNNECNISSQETIAELARQEAHVMEKITELRKKGLWSVRRVPKAFEPLHCKAHWDYVMEEMQWLAADFAQERKGKKAGARKVARMIGRHFQEVQQRGLKAEKEDALKLKRIASSIGKMVKEFWSNIEKVVHYKQQSRIGEKRKKALDLHLSFIVDQTEKYSSWLTEGLGASLAQQKSITSSPAQNNDEEDKDFKPDEGSTDDEETIEKDEQFFDEEETKAEVTALQKESEIPLDELLQMFPKNDGDDLTKTNAELMDSDVESYSPSDDETDDEETLVEQEQQEDVNHANELSELQEEGDMPLDELLKRYDGVTIENSFAECVDTKLLKKNDKDREGITYLVGSKDETIANMDQIENSGPGKEITDIAATAMSLQPAGNTLETAHVKTIVPFLLKHQLREYQHVGLDWLATMYEQRLNGILADEMGLGKTIQTIALLGYLACEKGIWGPHLIVVPTSVMLNWEMEFKKWCPAFKILTYYGSLKERKAKRTGWTKTNAFHVCITSYKLVIQDHQAFRRKKKKVPTATLR